MVPGRAWKYLLDERTPTDERHIRSIPLDVNGLSEKLVAIHVSLEGFSELLGAPSIGVMESSSQIQIGSPVPS